MTTPQLPDAEIEARVKRATEREPSIGDTLERDGHELMWDGGQWVHSPDCDDLDQHAIRALRARRLRLSLDEMAARLFVNRSTVWRWEHGAKPRPYQMRQLMKLAQEEAK